LTAPGAFTANAGPSGLRKETNMTTPTPTVPCCHCGKPVTYHYDEVNHRQHMWLTIFTLGLWAPMWLFDIVSKIKICDVCNKPTKE
jgi:hypothetical protein